MNQTNELIPTLTVDTNAILETMNILLQLCMKGKLEPEADKQIWQAHSILNKALVNSPECKAEFGE